MFILAVRSDDGLVFDVQTGVLSANLCGEKVDEIKELVCSLIHLTRSGYDQTLSLRRGPDGRLHGDFAPLRQERWTVQLEISQWRLVENLNLNWSPTLELLPQDASSGS
jgi:hypothetical protein